MTAAQFVELRHVFINLIDFTDMTFDAGLR